eukprot:1156352-Pelagomonas_calceolata.AAC.7
MQTPPCTQSPSAQPCAPQLLLLLPYLLPSSAGTLLLGSAEASFMNALTLVLPSMLPLTAGWLTPRQHASSLERTHASASEHTRASSSLVDSLHSRAATPRHPATQPQPAARTAHLHEDTSYLRPMGEALHPRPLMVA